MIDKEDSLWNNPSPISYYLVERWKQLGLKRFLDVGCGIGRHTIMFCQNNFDVTGFDLSEFGVETTKQKLKELNLKANLAVMDMLKLNYEPNSFDCALALHVISHTDTKGFKKILNDLYTFLKPNGELFFTLGTKESFYFNKPDCPSVDENTKIRVEDGPENGIPHFYANEQDIQEILGETKFKLISLEVVKRLTKFGNFSPHFYIHVKK